MYTPKDYKNLLGLKGFSDNALNTHFTLYEGYVKNVNSILEKLNTGKVETGSVEMAELQRRVGWEYNGMKLHEIYFESLSKTPNEISQDGNLYREVGQIYGSFENFIETFKKVGQMRGIGWVALVKGENPKELFIIWLEEHNTGHFANSKVLLCMDMLEHAFMLDYGTKKIDYINEFLNNVDWKVVEERFEK